eukprot:7540604-Pyramimonas_sp.AAC.1
MITREREREREKKKEKRERERKGHGKDSRRQCVALIERLPRPGPCSRQHRRSSDCEGPSCHLPRAGVPPSPSRPWNTLLLLLSESILSQ